MSRFFSAAVAATLVFTATAAPAQPAGDAAARLAEAHSILAVMFPPGEHEAMLKRLQTEMMGQLMPPQVAAIQDPGLKKIFAEFTAEAMVKQRAVLVSHLPRQIDAMATAYATRFSLDELKAIDAFAHSPAGQHYMAESTAIIGDPAVAKENVAMIADVREVTMALAPAFKDKLIAYMTAHPEVAKKIAAESKK